MPRVQQESPGTVVNEGGTGVEVVNWPVAGSYGATQRT